MENAKVIHVKLGNPPDGYRTVVWNDRLKERNMLVEAGPDWDIFISIDRSEACDFTYCLSVSPKRDELILKQMRQNHLPKEVRLVGDSAVAALSAAGSPIDQELVISNLKEQIDG